MALDEGSGDVVVIDLATGSVERTVARIDLEARWISRLQLNWDGTAVYYQAQTEDYWFSCDSSPGTIVHLDLTTGEEVELAAGAEPQISPDGTQVAYLAASQCLPDPTDKANFVVTPYDSVVVRDLATGLERRWTEEALGELLASTEGDVIEAQLGGLVWLASDELAVAGYRLGVESMDVSGAGADLRAEVGGSQRLIGLDAASGLVIVEQDFYIDDGDRMVKLLGIDPVTGETTEYSVSGSGDVVFAFDSQYQNLAAAGDGRLSIDGRSISLGLETINLDW